jgi:hypothetical protein
VQSVPLRCAWTRVLDLPPPDRERDGACVSAEFRRGSLRVGALRFGCPPIAALAPRVGDLYRISGSKTGGPVAGGSGSMRPPFPRPPCLPPRPTRLPPPAPPPRPLRPQAPSNRNGFLNLLVQLRIAPCDGCAPCSLQSRAPSSSTSLCTPRLASGGHPQQLQHPCWSASRSLRL